MVRILKRLNEITEMFSKLYYLYLHIHNMKFIGMVYQIFGPGIKIGNTRHLKYENVTK